MGCITRLHYGARWPGNIVKHRSLLVCRTIHERLVEPLLALDIQPGKPTAHPDLPRRLIDHHEVHELGHTGIGGAARAVVRGDDQIDEHAHRSPLVGRKEFRLKGGPGGGRRLRDLHQVVRMGGFRLGPGESSGKRRGRKQSKHVATFHQTLPTFR